MSWIARRRADLLAGLGLLTRLPVGWLARGVGPVDMARSVWTWPLVGLGAGAVGGAVLAGLSLAGVPGLPAAGWAVAVQILLTGGLHEDGLADMADGFGGGRDRARKLEIMRDSRIGAYGVLALGLSLLVRATAAAATPHPIAAMAVAGALSRATMTGVLAALPPARSDGIAGTMGGIPRPALGAGLLLSALAAAWLVAPARATAACLAAAVSAAGIARLARRQIGGQTGDVLGGTASIAECAILTVMAAV
ncbi:adenosylcobinamide-GDP ribazoletransferase [Gluconacetobacter azotocaptans]|uniref:Adenosylcobinamide-GDP ribazoletransferase n=2 Tax=Gluconacetobacter azotocaptans TaxID=142834 RepID=A0A7W4JSG0_9PROT|nr:adenosylcobinamide-GDP ribazoletransferase [Gluconacetobacter azotocaptans]MBB2190068.1 adenosylcobinamide-GDP ribazoletransferase [Gluconacetobacter azotocaptans]